MVMRMIVFCLAVLLSSWTAKASTNEYRADVIKVIDGDTVVLNIHLGFDISMVSHCRLYGVNTPELHKGTIDSIRAGNVSKNVTTAMLSGRTVRLLSIDDRRDKYGRVLGIIMVGGTNVNQYLLDGHYAVPMGDDGSIEKVTKDISPESVLPSVGKRKKFWLF
jgi:micrococcal nuclease